MVFNLLVHNKILVLQNLLTEIGSRFVTLPEERLLAVVNALLHRCYKYPTATTGEVPQSLKKELSGVCRACFSVDAVNKHVDFVRDYKQDFERDLDPESIATFPATLSELTARLKHWKNVLQSNVEDRFPTVLKLEEESKVLRDFHVVDVEVPGQYFCDQVIEPWHINFCDGFLLYIVKFSCLVWVNRSWKLILLLELVPHH
jgi:transformation/transcription domain-associated protein